MSAPFPPNGMYIVTVLHCLENDKEQRKGFSIPNVFDPGELLAVDTEGQLYNRYSTCTDTPLMVFILEISSQSQQHRN